MDRATDTTWLLYAYRYGGGQYKAAFTHTRVRAWVRVRVRLSELPVTRLVQLIRVERSRRLARVRVNS